MLEICVSVKMRRLKCLVARLTSDLHLRSHNAELGQDTARTVWPHHTEQVREMIRAGAI